MSFVVLTVICMELNVLGNFFILHIETADPNNCTAVSRPTVRALVS